jgi:hypothetical protein
VEGSGCNITEELFLRLTDGLKKKVKIKFSRYRPGQALGVPAG